MISSKSRVNFQSSYSTEQMWRAVLTTLLPQRLLSEKNTFNYPIPRQCSISKAPENIRKIPFLWCFQGVKKWTIGGK